MENYEMESTQELINDKNIEQNPMLMLTDAVWKIEGSSNFMEDALAILNELIDPIINGNDVDYIEVTRTRAKALYGSLTYLENLHEDIKSNIPEIYKAIKGFRNLS